MLRHRVPRWNTVDHRRNDPSDGPDVIADRPRGCNPAFGRRGRDRAGGHGFRRRRRVGRRRDDAGSLSASPTTVATSTSVTAPISSSSAAVSSQSAPTDRSSRERDPGGVRRALLGRVQGTCGRRRGPALCPVRNDGVSVIGGSDTPSGRNCLSRSAVRTGTAVDGGRRRHRREDGSGIGRDPDSSRAAEQRFGGDVPLIAFCPSNDENVSTGRKTAIRLGKRLYLRRSGEKLCSPAVVTAVRVSVPARWKRWSPLPCACFGHRAPTLAASRLDQRFEKDCFAGSGQ